VASARTVNGHLAFGFAGAVVLYISPGTYRALCTWLPFSPTGVHGF